MQIQNITYLSDRMSRIDTSQIRRAFDLASTLKNPINLSIGQPHYRMPEEIAEAIEKAIKDGKTSYTPTQGIFPLREKIAAKESIPERPVLPEGVLISSGVSSLLQLLFMSTIDPGDRILLIDPYFLMYKSLGHFFSACIETIPENFNEEDISGLNTDGLKLILYASPSNPSGYILSKDQIAMLGKLSERTGALLVADEIYELFDYDNTFTGAASVHPGTLILKGFSKTYNMTGLRLSYATGPEPIIKAMTILQQYTVVCAPAPVQWAGITALDLDMSDHIEQYRKNRNYCVNKLKGAVNFHNPSGAFYIFPEISGKDTEFAERAANEKNLIIVPGNIFSKKTNHIRISFATTEENLSRGIDAFLSLL